MNRCIEHIFGYCASKPLQVEKEETRLVFDYKGKEHLETETVIGCRNTWQKCPHFQTFTQTLAPSPSSQS